MSELYEQQIKDLTAWFKDRIAAFDPFDMTRGDYKAGIDKLPKNYHGLTTEAFDLWLSEKHYELSYNQMCKAFFGAALELKKVRVGL